MQFYAPGKLMISGEYAVLNGATAFAIPTKGYGQTLSVNSFEQSGHYWKSFDLDGQWFDVLFSPDLLQIIKTTNQSQAIVIQRLLLFIKKQKPSFFTNGLVFKTELSFNRMWGFGSSASLIALLSKWSGIPPFELLDISFGGSGYDLAVAMENKPLLYRLSNQIIQDKPIYRNKQPSWQSVEFSPCFADDIFLIYLNLKQNSRKEIEKYERKPAVKKQVSEISNISKALVNCHSLDSFEFLISNHEQIISEILQRPTVQEEFFSDYPGKIKSLGAWGGDFILATRQEAPAYFRSKGLHTIINLKYII